MPEPRGGAGEPPSSSLLPPVLRWSGPLLAAGYGLGARVHRALSTPQFAPLPTLCIGNITVGGTGKTPATKYFARRLAERGRTPAVLMRGYKGQGNDEAVEVTAALQDLKIPVLLGGDRLASARAAKARGRDVVLLDDGFQHWRLARDLDIVLIDATNSFGGGRLAPWGRLRETPKALARAGVVIVTRSDLISADALAALNEEITKLAPQAALARARHRPARLLTLDNARILPIENLRDQAVVALCGIGNPSAFCKTLEKLGADVKGVVAFSDHHDYRPENLNDLILKHTQNNQVIVTTEKDAAKLIKNVSSAKVWVLEVQFEILEGEAAVWNKVDEALRSAALRNA